MIGTEVAFVLDPETGVESVLRALEGFRCREGAAGGSRRSVFYDTFDGRLHRRGSSLCALEDDGEWRLCWRNGKGIDVEAVTGLPIAFASELPPGHLRRTLEPVLEARRLLPLVEIEHRGPALDVVDDEEKTVVRVRLEEGRARAPRELAAWEELPLVLRVAGIRGYDREWKEVLQALADLPELSPTSAGALDVALAAIGGTPYGAKPLFSPSLAHGVRADVGLKRVFTALSEVIFTNEAGVRMSLDTEFLHDFRVAVRRTRAVLGQLKGVFPKPVADHFREEFAWLGRVTGPTRDLDVFLIEIDQLAVGETEADLAPLREFLRVRQQAEHAELVAALDSPRYADMMLAWRRFLDETPLPDPPQRRAAEPLADVAADRIRKTYKRVLSMGSGVCADSSTSDLHALRLECKKLRYVLDATKSLFDERESQYTITSLKKFQETLGGFNDCSVQADKLREYSYSMSEESRAPVGTLLAMGRLVERTGERARKLRETFAKRFTEFADPKNKKHVKLLLKKRSGSKRRGR